MKWPMVPVSPIRHSSAHQCHDGRLCHTKGRVTDKTKSCGLTVVGGTITVSNKAGVGDHVRWTLSSTDDTGNNATKVCEVLIVS